ncbi:MAG: threonylcarbamoyl-AMP synthase [Candidatus Lindowbacteria bacterium]|nr:threonylcarbamoyl-AMP synthase [Candidatus Lindowbacteria bacterium]
MKIFEVDPEHPDHELVSEIVALLKKGAVIAYPTDTLYALGGDAFNKELNHRIRILKGREGTKPLPHIIDEAERLAQWRIRLSPPAAVIAAKFWPGPVSIVVKGSSALPAEVLDSRKTICVRVPDCRIARSLAGGVSGLLVATSANPSGQPPARTAHEAAEYFRGEIDAVVDGGPSASELPSTIVDVSGRQTVILREGALRSERIKAVIAMIENQPDTNEGAENETRHSV